MIDKNNLWLQKELLPKRAMDVNDAIRQEETFSGNNVTGLDKPVLDKPILTKADLFAMIASGELIFPFRYTYSPYSKQEMYDALIPMTPQAEFRPDDVRLHSYYPRLDSLVDFDGNSISVNPPPIIGLRVDWQSPTKCDGLVDLYCEDLRLDVRRADFAVSAIQAWSDPIWLDKILEAYTSHIKSPMVEITALRTSISKVVAEAGYFSITRAIGILAHTFGVLPGEMANKSWLDISSGWGDRLLAACRLDMEYDGYDPNTAMQERYQAMIDDFGTPGKQTVTCAPFEKAQLKDKMYDVVLTSPPFYDVELYSEEDTQSNVAYPGFNNWMNSFLFVAILKAWNKIKPDGYFVLHLGDTKTITMAEPANCYIQQFCPGSQFVRCLHLISMSGYGRPVWIWKKINKVDKINGIIEVNTLNFRPLDVMYPQLVNPITTACEIVSSLNPPMKVMMVKGVTVWNDNILPGGNKQRAADVVCNEYRGCEVVLAAATGKDHVALSYAGMMCGCKVTIFAQASKDGENLIKASIGYRANVTRIHGPFKKALVDARAYAEQDTNRRFLSTFNFVQYTDQYEVRMRQALKHVPEPRRIWMSIFNGIKVRTLGKIFPNTQFCCVAGPRDIMQADYDAFLWSRMTIFTAGNVISGSPFPTGKMDAGLWALYQKHKQDGDVIYVSE